MENAMTPVEFNKVYGTYPTLAMLNEEVAVREMTDDELAAELGYRATRKEMILAVLDARC